MNTIQETSTVNYKISPFDPIRQCYKIMFDNGTTGTALLIPRDKRDIPKEIISELEQTLNGSYGSLNCFALNYFPFGTKKETFSKYEGQGLASRIYDDLDMEKDIAHPALILARPTAPQGMNPEGTRIDNLLRKKGFTPVDTYDGLLLYKLIV